MRKFQMRISMPKIVRQFILFFAFLHLTLSSLHADKKAVILAGSGGTEKYAMKFYDQATKLREILLTKFAFRENDLHLFMETATDSLLQFTPNDAGSIKSVFSKLKQDLKQQDVLLIFLLGHGTYDGEWAKLNIEGADLRDIDFANLVDQLPTDNILFVNMASASGPFLEKLSHKGRIIITATRNGLERNATRFAEHFLSALEQDFEADLNKDGELSVTEAFIFARDNLVRDYDEKKQLRPEHPLLDDNGDGEGTETPDLLAGDGVLASRFLFKQEKAQSRTASEATLKTPLSPAQQKILEQVRKLQEQKSAMPEDEYYKAFEKLMIELARLKERKQ
jgi:hypothetical protein